MIKLFGHYDSGHVYKVALFLELAKIEYDYEHVDIWCEKSQRQAEFIAHSKHGEVPCLLMDNEAFVQSNLILYKLATQFKVFGGESSHRLLMALEWQFWEANRIGMCLPQLRYAKRFAPDEFNPQSLNFLTDRFVHDVDVLEKHLADNKKFMIDDEPSIADFSMCCYLFHAEEAQVNLPENVNQWLYRIRQLDGWKAPYELLKKDNFDE